MATPRGKYRPDLLTTGLARTLVVALCLGVAAPPALFAQDPPAAEAEEAPAGGPKKVNLVGSGLRIDAALMAISNQAGVAIQAYGKVPGTNVNAVIKDMDIEAALNQLATPNGWVWFREKDGSYGLADQEWYKTNKLPEQKVQKIFRPDHVKASELEKAIKPMLTDGISSITADDRTNKLIVEDLPEVIERIERLIREIDVQLFTRVFYIRFADVAEIAKKIENYKSEPGTIEVDEITHQIIVTDLLANIKKMELLIDILDVGPEIVIYDVNNVGLEGEDLEDLKTIIENIRTPDLLFEVNEKQGVFILEDVPETHQRVEQLLAGFDRPVKQVLIQGEVLSTTFNRDFNFGVKRFISSKTLTIPATNSFSGEGFRTIEGTGDFTQLVGNVFSGSFIDDRTLLEWEATFNDSRTRVLLQPRILVKNQETSNLFVGREEPYLTTYFNDDDNNVSRSTSQQTVTDGLTFEVTPSISNSLLVEMEISIDNDNAEVVTRNSSEGVVDLIARDRQNIETVLTIPSGQTRVIGGLLNNSSSESSGGLPWISRVPYIGALFGNQARGEGREMLQLFITPTVVEDVIPRPTGTDGNRGRMVTAYEKVPGTYDVDFGSTTPSATDPVDDPVEGEVLDTSTDATANQAEIQSLLRETAPREDVATEAATSNYVPRQTGGSAVIGTDSKPVNVGGDAKAAAAPAGNQPRGGNNAAAAERVRDARNRQAAGEGEKKATNSNTRRSTEKSEKKDDKR